MEAIRNVVKNTTTYNKRVTKHQEKESKKARKKAKHMSHKSHHHHHKRSNFHFNI